MAKEVYQLEELDDATAQYLRDVRNRNGEGLPGIYLPNTTFGGIWAILLGFAVLLIVFFAVSPPLNDPINVTMLLTAGLLFGGWLILAGIRIYLSRARGTNLGNFWYGDPWQIWTVNGTHVERIPIDQVVDVKLLENVDSEKNYANSVLTFQFEQGSCQLLSFLQIGAQEFLAYLQFWLTARGEGTHTQKLVEQNAAKAKAYAYDQDWEEYPPFSLEIPKPQKIREASFGWLNLATVMACGIGLFFLVHPLVNWWRDEAIYNLVRNRPPQSLRSYLIDPRNTLHRDEVQKLLAKHYDEPIRNLEELIRKKADPKFDGSADAMVAVLRPLAETTQPILTLRVDETVLPNEQLPGDWKRTVQTRITEALIDSIGPNLLSIAEAPPGIPAMIELSFKIMPEKANHRQMVWKLVLRKSPDEEPIFRKTWQTEAVDKLLVNKTFEANLLQAQAALTGRDRNDQFNQFEFPEPDPN